MQIHHRNVNDRGKFSFLVNRSSGFPFQNVCLSKPSDNIYLDGAQPANNGLLVEGTDRVDKGTARLGNVSPMESDCLDISNFLIKMDAENELCDASAPEDVQLRRKMVLLEKKFCEKEELITDQMKTQWTRSSHR